MFLNSLVIKVHREDRKDNLDQYKSDHHDCLQISCWLFLSNTSNNCRNGIHENCALSPVSFHVPVVVITFWYVEQQYTSTLGPSVLATVSWQIQALKI